MKKLIIVIMALITIFSASVSAFALSSEEWAIVDYISNVVHDGYNCSLVCKNTNAPTPSMTNLLGYAGTQETTFDLMVSMYEIVTLQGAHFINNTLMQGVFSWYEYGGYCWILFDPDGSTGNYWVGNKQGKILYCEAPEREDIDEKTLNFYEYMEGYIRDIRTFLYNCKLQTSYTTEYCQLIDQKLQYIKEYFLEYKAAALSDFSRIYGKLNDIGNYVDDLEVLVVALETTLTTNFDTLTTNAESILVTLERCDSRLSNIEGDCSNIYTYIKLIHSDIESIAEFTGSTYSFYDLMIKVIHVDGILTTLSSDLSTNFTTLFDSLTASASANEQLYTLEESIDGRIGRFSGSYITFSNQHLLPRLNAIVTNVSNIYDRLGEIQDAVVDADNVIIDITTDNDAFNIFYVEKTDGTTESVGETATDAAKVVGEFLSVFYRLIFADGLGNADIIHDFEEVYTVTDSGVSVW